jgi:hypothetical protein
MRILKCEIGAAAIVFEPKGLGNEGTDAARLELKRTMR